MKNKTLASFLIGLSLTTFMFVYAEDASESYNTTTSTGETDTTGFTPPVVNNDWTNPNVRPDGAPGNYVYHWDSGYWGPPASSNPGGTVSAPVNPSAPSTGGTPSCPTSGQTCNYDYIYSHSVACGIGGNGDYCAYGCINNGGTATNFGAYCAVPRAPSVSIWFTAN